MSGYEIEKSSLVNQFIDFKPAGNIIPSPWFGAIQRKGKGKPKAYLLAINLLADLVYWYRPIETRDEKTGAFVGYRKKFKGDMLQRNYTDWAVQFGVSKNQVVAAVRFLCAEKLLIRDVRILRLPTMTLGGVTFFAPNKKAIDKISQSTEPQEVETPPLQKNRPTPINLETPPLKKIGPCTEITTETTTKNSGRERKKEMPSSSNVGDFAGALNDIFEFWKIASGHLKAKLGFKRKQAITYRLKEGYTVDNVKLAIQGCLDSTFLAGDNPNGKTYDDIEMICRDETRLEKLRDERIEAMPNWISGCCKARIDFIDSKCTGCDEIRNIDDIHEEWLKMHLKVHGREIAA